MLKLKNAFLSADIEFVTLSTDIEDEYRGDLEQSKAEKQFNNNLIYFMECMQIGQQKQM
jgi:hypothetical protein